MEVDARPSDMCKAKETSRPPPKKRSPVMHELHPRAESPSRCFRVAEEGQDHEGTSPSGLWPPAEEGCGAIWRQCDVL